MGLDNPTPQVGMVAQSAAAQPRTHLPSEVSNNLRSWFMSNCVTRSRSLGAVDALITLPTHFCSLEVPP